LRRFEALALSILTCSCNGLLGHDSPTLIEASPCDDASFATDPVNCGSCGHDCLGGSCSGGTCGLITLASKQAYASYPLIKGPYVYWANYQALEIVRILKDGSCTDPSCVEKVVPTNGIVVDGYVRWVAFSGDSLLWATYNDIYPASVAQLDADGGYTKLGSVTWSTGNLLDGTDVYASAIEEPWLIARMTVGQSGVTPVVTTATTTDAGTSGGTVYAMLADASGIWFAEYVSGNIYLLGRGQTCVLGSTCNAVAQGAGPVAMAQDDASLYVSNRGDSTIVRIDKQTHAKTVLATGQKQCQAILIDGTKLYWGNIGDATIRALENAATTTATCTIQTCPIIAMNQGLPSGFVTDSQAIYWTTQAGDGVTSGPAGTLVKLAK
jgi:hypothetical protein